MRLPSRHAWVCLTLLLAAMARPATADEVSAPDVFEFDARLLRQRGLSLETGAYFAKGPRFRPGTQSVGVVLNGRDIGLHTALFGTDGKICLNGDFLASVGMEPGPDQHGPTTEGPDCGERAAWLSRVEVQLLPATGTLWLTVPEELVRPTASASQDRHGGVGAALNYQAFLSDNRGPGGSSSFRYLSTEAGLNLDDWVIRSRHMFTRIDGRGLYRWAGAWAQRSFPNQRRLFQAGRISTADALYGGLPLTGFQWVPDTAHRQQSRFALEGQAAGRSRVELRQAGVLLHTTFVPAGPFRLTDYPLQNPQLDLEMRVIDEAGGVQVTVVPATSLLLALQPVASEGWGVAGGRLWDRTENRSIQTRPVVLGSYTFARNTEWSQSAGALLASGYRSMTLATQWRLSPQSSAYGQWMSTEDLERNRQGSATSALLSTSVGGPLRLGVSARLQSRNFRSLPDAAQFTAPSDDSAAVQSRVGLQMTVIDSWARGFSAGLTQDRNFRGDPHQTYNLGWGTTAVGATLQLGLSRSFSQLGSDTANLSAARPGTQAYATLTFALGATGSSSSYLRSAGDAVLSGSSFSQQVSEHLGWSANVDRQSAGATGQPASSVASFQASVRPRYVELGLGVSQGSGSVGRHLDVSGSVLATGDGVAFGPAPVQDTFGTARLGDIAGIRVDGMSGSAWSGPGGLVAIASLLPFQESRLEVWGPSVPLDVNVERGLVTVQAARGAVLRIDMGAHRVRRVLLTLLDAAGQPLPEGTAVLTDGGLAATVGRNGRALLELQDGLTGLRALPPDQVECRIGEIVLQTGQRQGPFESGRASCLPPGPPTGR
jgi:outer membrane usher protein FimD/PapC